MVKMKFKMNIICIRLIILTFCICRYPEDQVPSRTSYTSRQKARHANHTPLRTVNLSMNRTARVLSPEIDLVNLG
jgi:hypothetical protein